MLSIITKNGFFGIIVLLYLAFFFACKKETPTIITPIDLCAQNYELYSKPYENMFKGTYINSCAVTAKMIYPDKYSYTALGINPKNKYEICYLREDNYGSLWYRDLYKYNFCTNKTNLIATQVQIISDWSNLDYILFVNPKDNKTYRIKSNGDSLKIFSNTTIYTGLKWSPKGTKIIAKDVILDFNGNTISKIPIAVGSYQWESDSTILYDLSSTTKDFEIYHYNINTKISKLLHKEPLDGVFVALSHYSPQQSKIYAYIQKKNYTDYIVFDSKTLERKLLGSYIDSFSPAIIGSFENKLLANFRIKDTIPSQKCMFKHRNHIALMNFDGTKERQVLIPE
jgi:hypothetical protein